jgi:DNA-directed RNA polymerase subunit RPC12/RpoP
MSDEVITLWRYRDLPEALMAWTKLQSAGIECSLADKEIVRLDWFWSNAFGGVRLQLAGADAEDALALLADEIPASFPAEEVGEEYVQPECPECRSRDVAYEKFNRGLATLFLGLGLVSVVPSLPVWIPRLKPWKCEDCGHRWKGEYV